MDSVHSVFRSARSFFAGTLFSRISGAARDVAMAFCFGSSPHIAAFMVAYRFAHLFRRLFGEGNVQASFIPHFESLKKENPKKALLFYRDTSFSLTGILFGAIVVMELVLALCSPFLEKTWQEIFQLSMWMMPGLFFICLYALNSALLQAERSFFLPAVAPALFNGAWIGTTLLVRGTPPEKAVFWLALGVVIALALQWAATAYRVRRSLAPQLSWNEWFRPELFSAEGKKLAKPFSLGLLGVGAVQINGMLDALFARCADPSGPAFLWYAIRLEQLPLALFGIALSGALLPPLSRAMKEGAEGRYKELFHAALRQSAALMIPCTFGLFVLGAPGLNLLYGRGDFSSADVEKTLVCLWGYAIGLLPSTFTLLLASGSYAQKTYAIPAFASLASVGVNAALNALFVFAFGWGAFSIALATSLASFVNCALLGRNFRRHSGALFSPLFWGHAGRLLLCAVGAVACTLSVGAAAFYNPLILEGGAQLSRSFPEQLTAFGAMALAFLLSFGIFAYFLKIEEIKILFRLRDC